MMCAAMENNCTGNKKKSFKEKGMKTFLLFVLLLLCGIVVYGHRFGRTEKRAITKEVKNNLEYHIGADDTKEKREELSLFALSAALIDGKTGRVLYEKKGYEVMPMASTTKIMTCLLALEYGKKHPLEQEWVTVSAYAASQPKVKAGLREGEKYRLSDLLYSMMLESHNDTAVAIAEHIGRKMTAGTEAKCKEESKVYVKIFTDKMDKKAQKIGCCNTNFVTPNGLDAEDEMGKHATTAVELGKIAAIAMQNQEFCKIIRTMEYAFCDQSAKHSIHVNNKDAYLTLENGACGIKTGFTNQAGYCFVGARQDNDNLFISVVLGCGWPPEKSKKWSDTRKIMGYGIKNFKQKKITYHPFEQYMHVRNGKQEYCKVILDETPDEIVLLAPFEKIAMIQYQKGELCAPVYKGEIVGYQDYIIDGKLWKKIPIRAQECIDVMTIVHCAKKVTKLWLL